VLVTDLTAQQAQQRISDLLSELREIDRRKDEFLATLAHELRGPLAPLRNMLEVMKRAGANPELMQQARSTMDRQLVQMTRLIDDLLDVSRISRGRIELKREQLDLASLVQQALEACRPLAEHARHTIDVALPAEPIRVNADPVRLAQVFSNLLNNACKYTAAGGRISLRAESQGSEVVVTIRDNGVGIPADKLSGIFEMFTQVDQSLERSQGGLGIGLNLAKRLVELHGGTVAAQSEGAGKGSQFTVRLPIVVADPPVDVASQPIGRAEATQRILIVDDNRDSAASLAMLLDLAGYETFLAHDGLEAVAAAERFRPDVILLDLGLPKLNGFDAARRIRNEVWGKTMRLIALTGWGQEDDRRRSSESGFDAHIVKPVDLGALMSLLGSRPIRR
jgi:CheY-like chemotaxis protein